MSDALNLAMTITAADMFSGVLRRFRDRVTGAGEAAKKVQKDYDRMVTSIDRGVKALAVTGYIAAKMRPGITAAAELQGEMIGVRAELSGANTDAAELAKNMAEVKKTAFGVQAVTPFDIGQIVALEKELIKAGAKIQDVVGDKGAAAAASALATYEKMEPVMAGEALIGIGTPFKIAADGYADLADKISRAASASTVGAQDIAMSAKYAAGPLADMARSKDEMLALVAMMAQVGVRGEMAGTSLKNFFLQAAKSKALTTANGDLKSTADIIETLRRRTDGMGTAERSSFLTKIFGEQGLPVALAMLNQGKGSFEEIVVAMREALPLSEKLKLQMEGFSRQVTSLGGTGKSAMAILFEPALAPLTALIAKTNEWTAALGKAGMENENIGKAVSYGAGGTALAVGAYGIFKLLQGGGSGLKMLQGLKDAGSTAGGVAAGKALEAAAGVSPVFVVNWPGSGVAGVGGAGEAAAGAGAATVAGKVFSKSKTTLALLAGTPLSKLPWLGAGAVGMAGAGVAAAGGVGYGIGSLANKLLLENTETGRVVGDKIGESIARVLSLFGNEAARQAIAGNERAQQMRGEVVVRVRPERGAEARTDRPHSNGTALDLQAETEVGSVGRGVF